MSDEGRKNMAIGAKMGMRAAARDILAVLDGFTEAELAECGWHAQEAAALERIAAWHIAGMPMGDWPR